MLFKNLNKKNCPEPTHVSNSIKVPSPPPPFVDRGRFVAVN